VASRRRFAAARQSLRAMLVVLGIAALLGCQAIDDGAGDERAGAGSGVHAACPVKHGRYGVVLTPVGDGCEPPDFASVQVDDNITIEKFLKVDVETETVIDGCLVFLSRTERDKATGVVSSTLQGTLSAQRDSQLGGTVNITLFDASGALRCQGAFDADLTASTTVTGVAR
jgi:hypothetical protein